MVGDVVQSARDLAAGRLSCWLLTVVVVVVLLVVVVVCAGVYLPVDGDQQSFRLDFIFLASTWGKLGMQHTHSCGREKKGSVETGLL